MDDGPGFTTLEPGRRLQLVHVSRSEPPPADEDSYGAPPPSDEPPPVAEEPSEFKEGIVATVKRFNNKFMVVNEAGKAVILQPSFDQALMRKRMDRMTPKDLQLLYLNEMIPVGRDKKGKVLMRTVADVWIRHPDRKQYVEGVVFDPSGAQRRGVLNLWRGYGVEPKPGDWSLLRQHLLRLVCSGNQDICNYLIAWMARMLQSPAEQGEVAVVLKGVEGCGKGTVARALKRIIGHHALAISNAKHLVGNFNAHLRDVIFLFADEAFFAGDRAHVGVLKSIITEPYLTVEAKYANAIEAPNFLHVMMASNEEWVIPASLEARRFLMLEVLDTAVGDHAYFGAIWKQMEDGGYAAMLHDLLNLDLTGFNVRAVPQTTGLEKQRKLSLDTTTSWWKDCLERGYVFRSKLGLEAEFERWRPKIATELLFASYVEFATSRRERHLLARETLGRFLISMGGEAKRWRSDFSGEHLVEETNSYGSTVRRAKGILKDRVHGYSLGELADARDRFERHTGLSILWDDGQDQAEDDLDTLGGP